MEHRPSARPAPHLAPLPAGLPDSVPFVGPETLERQRGAPFVARLGANENGFGPSPRAVAAMRDAAAEVWKYGDPTNHDLKAALAAHCGVGPENVVVGEGIDALLGLANAFTNLGHKREACDTLDDLRSNFPNLRQPQAERAAETRRRAGCRHDPAL